MQHTDALNYAHLIISNYTSVDTTNIKSADRRGTDLYVEVHTDVKLNIEMSAIHNSAWITNRGKNCIRVRNAYNNNGDKTLDRPIRPLEIIKQEPIRSSLGVALYSGLGDFASMSFVKDSNEFESLKSKVVIISGLKAEDDDNERPLLFNYEGFAQFQGEELHNEIVRMISAWETFEAIRNKASIQNPPSEQEKARQQGMFMNYCDVLCQASIMLNGEKSVTRWVSEEGVVTMQVLGKVGGDCA